MRVFFPSGEKTGVDDNHMSQLAGPHPRTRQPLVVNCLAACALLALAISLRYGE